MKNVKQDQVLMLTVIIPYFILLVSKQAKICVPDIENLNVKVFNLMSRTSETRFIEWHETCKYKCRLDELFVIINNDEIKINVDVNVKN